MADVARGEETRSVNKMPLWEAYLKLKEDSQRTPEEVEQQKREAITHATAVFLEE